MNILASDIRAEDVQAETQHPDGYVEYCTRAMLRDLITEYGPGGARLKLAEWLADEAERTWQ